MDHLPLNETVVDRVERLIRDSYWKALTRRVDIQHLSRAVSDPKIHARCDYLYLAHEDREAWRHFKNCSTGMVDPVLHRPICVEILPPSAQINGDYIRSLDGAHGLLALKLASNGHPGSLAGVPYLAPGGRFNELYYWDCYFLILGLLQDGLEHLALNLAENLLHLVRYFGKVPNANRTYYLTRSQPPFLSSIIRAIWERGSLTRSWLAEALGLCVREYKDVWLGSHRLVRIGPHELSRYYDEGDGPCPEVESGHYDEKILPWLRLAPPLENGLPLTPYRFLKQFLYAGMHDRLQVDGMTLAQFFKHDRAARESGHDTTHRFDDRTADFATADLNALLYKYECDIAVLIEREFGGCLSCLGSNLSRAADWRDRAIRRKEAVQNLLWNPRLGYFFDYDHARNKRSDYISATGLYPLWAGMLDIQNPAEREQARLASVFAFRHLEESAGLAASARKSVASSRAKDLRQWDYPHGWAPHQMMAWMALRQSGQDEVAGRLAYRWLHALALNAAKNNDALPEKLNVVNGSQDVFVEYGNVGTQFEQVATEGFGWTNASFKVGLGFLSSSQRRDLHQLKSPPPLDFSPHPRSARRG